MEDRKEFELKGTVRIATYPFRLRDFYSSDVRIMIYHELGEQLVLCVDLNQNSDEDFNFDYDEYKENELISTNGIKITLTEDEEFVCDHGGAIDIYIKGSKKSYKWRISNDHNGYDAHSVDMMHDGEYIWSEWL